MSKGKKFFVCDMFFEGDNIQIFEKINEAKEYAHECIEAYREQAAEEGAWSEKIDGIYIGEITHKAVPETVQKKPRRSRADDFFWPWGDGDWIDYSIKKI